MATNADEPKGSGLPLSYWKAVATLPSDRSWALAELETAFLGGSAPERLDGPRRGRLLTTTFGYGLDGVAGAMARLWMPWRGKTFDPEAGDGRNLFTTGARPMIRLLWPDYRGVLPDAPRRITAFRFVTGVGSSAFFPDLRVLRIDYDLPENPAWPLRRILDELVRLDEGVYLGQALLHWRGRFRRAAWFSLEG